MYDKMHTTTRREGQVMDDKTRTLVERLKKLFDACGPQWPLRVEEDWTAEIIGADGSLIGKIMYPKHLSQARALVDAFNALADLLPAIEAQAARIEETDHALDLADHALDLAESIVASMPSNGGNWNLLQRFGATLSKYRALFKDNDHG